MNFYKKHFKVRFIVPFLLVMLFVSSDALLLIPMDKVQTDHLKAYGVVFGALQRGEKAFWLLNYRGGSFALESSTQTVMDASRKGVFVREISNSEYGSILAFIDDNNMDRVTLERSPKMAIYTPPGKLPWDDAVTLALTYAEIPYDAIYDREVLTGKLDDYDWLHLHHEDFTGQYSKFYRSFRHTQWYNRQKMELENLSRDLGFSKVSNCKKAVALAIKSFVELGGFLFAMCSATNTLDIALAALGTDIVEVPFDGDGIDPDYRSKLNYDNCFAFQNFSIETGAMASHFGNIDFNLVNTPYRKDAVDFELFDFSAKLDPVPSMLTQNHQRVVPGFFGLLTSFNRSKIKKSIVVLGDVPGTERVRYLHGIKGKGQFAFYGGHDPEDYAHLVGDKHTMLELHKHSPGYRLILNNVLFPAAEKKEKRT